MQEKMDNPIDRHFREQLEGRSTPPPAHLEEAVLARVAAPPARRRSGWAWSARAAVLLCLLSLGLEEPAEQGLWPEKGGPPAGAAASVAAPAQAAVTIAGLEKRGWAPLQTKTQTAALEAKMLAWTPSSDPEGREPIAPSDRPVDSPATALAVNIKLPETGYFADERADTTPEEPLVDYARAQWKRLRQGEKPTLPKHWKEKPILAFNLPRW
ncbi:MAG: hypothetical protein RI842_10230 [Schleiferiaceae bacterium]|nr:hypothetical protein [Schleiferiaceae bacterium]MDR9443086.1 hypothetical protein [Schleiferiaceae bacterium]